MTSAILHDQAKKFIRKVPAIEPGNTVRVHERVKEGEKERIQMFEGIVIGVHKGHTSADQSFTVRKIVSGIGVEKVFPVHSPVLEKIEVKKVAKVRRAKLNFLRGRKGKAARMNEKFIKDFGEAVAPVVAEANVEEAPAEEVKA